MKSSLLLMATLVLGGGLVRGEPTLPLPIDATWAHVQELTSKALGGGSRAQRARRIRAVGAEADSFARTYADDPRRWEAQILAVHSRLRLTELTGGGVKADDRDVMKAILAAAEAALPVRDEAAYLLQILQFRALEPKQVKEVSAFLKGASVYQAEYGTSARAPEIARYEMMLISLMHPPESEEVLRSLATHPDTATAAAALKQLDGAERENGATEFRLL